MRAVVCGLCATAVGKGCSFCNLQCMIHLCGCTKQGRWFSPEMPQRTCLHVGAAQGAGGVRCAGL